MTTDSTRPADPTTPADTTTNAPDTATPAGVLVLALLNEPPRSATWLTTNVRGYEGAPESRRTPAAASLRYARDAAPANGPAEVHWQPRASRLFNLVLALLNEPPRSATWLTTNVRGYEGAPESRRTPAA
ncbi:hypothetical protein MTQ22_05040, partial [Corynebacterium bovis]